MIARQKEIRLRQEKASRPLMQAEIAARAPTKAPPSTPAREYAPGTDPRRIMAKIATEFGVSLGDITGPSMRPHVIKARFAAIHAVSQAHPHLRPSQLGSHFGGRDRSSIISALRRIERDGVPQPSVCRRGEVA